MIRDQWYVILESKEVKHELVGVKRFSENLALYQADPQEPWKSG